MNSGVKQEEQVSYVVEISIQLKEYSKSNKTNSKHQAMNRVGLKLTFQVKEKIQKIAARYHQEEDGINLISAIVCLNLGAFENEIKDFIVIGGDWNAHHSAVVFIFADPSNIVVNQKTSIKLSRDLRKNIGKPYKQLLKITYTSTITKANKLVLRLNRNSNVDKIQDTVNDINTAVSDKHIICHMSDSEFKTKKVVVKGICPKEDITDIQSELENEEQHKNEILDPNTAIRSFTKHNDIHTIIDMYKILIIEKNIFPKIINTLQASDCYDRAKDVTVFKERVTHFWVRCLFTLTETNYKKYKREAMQLRQEKQEYLIKSIQSLKEENTRKLFSQFKSMNSNKITVIPALVESTTGDIAKTDKEKAEMLVSWFYQLPQNHQVILKQQKNITN
ncbi:hypothetical protein RFI_35374 [Reticulomyxa filosa]|uniref:Uncharacterized protein n=1 Tax=Reticulomyxa filosa TaxID=46433 RepID=X6LLQ0_RETFI|nr:hypothetical protein RFI_35374 [Reticulomyxa filosa]|eukprot:ETO02062.1 hypothetical protein RFI_35374 [Reticulomyxa filosa]